MNLFKLYQGYKERTEFVKSPRALLEQTHWFSTIADFDPKTSEAMTLPLSTLLSRIVASADNHDGIKDRLWRITEHSRAPIERLFRTMNESPRREQAIMPIRAVRELNTASLIALSRRPGRNVREKLADKPYLQAVRRFQSIDLPENRLLKTFVLRLLELLELRRDCLDEEDALLLKLQKWSRSDEALAISRWDNLPPNNTLLSHRDYRRIWDAWRWLQTLDEDINADFERFDIRLETMRKWSDYGKMYHDRNCLFAEMPVFMDFDRFVIEPWTEILTQKTKSAVIRNAITATSIDKPFCIDLTTIHPHGTFESSHYNSFHSAFIWQRWEGDAEPADINLFESDAVYLHENAVTVSSEDLFFSDDKKREHLDCAARTFASKLRMTFKNDILLWLMPDFLNEFQLEITRRNINARFSQAKPLPRSIAAAFEKDIYAKIKNDGYPILVIDTVGGEICATKLIARFDATLKERLPETKGYLWERCPPVIISDSTETLSIFQGIPYIDRDGQWHESVEGADTKPFNHHDLRMNDKIGEYGFFIEVSESCVLGGIRFHELQNRAGDIPLWRDHIPELSIKVIVTGKGYRSFTLVGKNVTITPVRDVAVRIPVTEEFTLPAGRPFYSFPLFQGVNESALEYEARLESPSFPLDADLTCKLNMTYTYGADDPYRLVFEPIDGSLAPIVTKWQPKSEDVVTDAPGPEYPNPLTWNDMYRWEDPAGQRVNLLYLLTESLGKLIEICKVKRDSGTIRDYWRGRTSPNGEIYWFTFISTQSGDRYCNSNVLLNRSPTDPNIDYPAGTEVFFSESKSPKDGKIRAVDVSKCIQVSPSKYQLQRLQSFRERSLQNRMTAIWADARSVNDCDCPPEFKTQIRDLFGILMSELPASIIENKMMGLLSCMHKDSPDTCVQWLKKQVANRVLVNSRAVGNALGDLSSEWQKEILRGLIDSPDNFAISVFAYAIWREKNFVSFFTLSELQRLLNSLKMRLKGITPFITGGKKNGKNIRRQWIRYTAEPLELLLGLLRTRESLDAEIRMLLQPQQPFAVALAEIIEELIEKLSISPVGIYSRLQLDVYGKPIDDKTPDLLYALRVYLTGDNSINAIRVTGVSDED